MGRNDDEGKLPGWTILVALTGFVIAPMIVEACRDFGLPWVIGIPAAIVVAVGGAVAERMIERKYLGSRQR